MNNDKMIDVIVSSPYGGLVWFENPGGFNFVSHTITNDPSGFVETGDINNDGDIDIISVIFPDSIKIWGNDGFGNFINTQITCNTAWRLRLGDLDEDGDLDLINGDIYGATTIVYFNDGTGNFNQVASLNTPRVDGLWSRDFNNDGDEDILTAKGVWGAGR